MVLVINYTTLDGELDQSETLSEKSIIQMQKKKTPAGIYFASTYPIPLTLLYGSKQAERA